MTNPSAGQFVWYELMTSNPQAAKAFYADVVGWSVNEVGGMADMVYSMWVAADGPVGGLMQLPEQAKTMGAPPHWLAYAGVADVDATAAKAKALGGSVLVEPTDIPNMGRFAILTDPQGAAIAAYQSAEPGAANSAELVPVGHFSWADLSTTDYEAGWGFYESLFGWRKTEAMDMGPGGTYQMFAAGERTLGGMLNKAPVLPAPPAWLYYIKVADLDVALEKVRAGGGKVLNGPMVVPGGDRVAQCMDPQGAAFALHQNVPQ